MAHVLLLIAKDGFQTTEFNAPKRILEDAGHKVSVASDGAGIATSNIGEETTVDLVLTDVHAKDYDALFVVGGPGALLHLDNQETIRIVQEAKQQEAMHYGAICIAPRILAKAGVLEGLRVTGWDNDGKFESICGNGGCIYVPEPVVIDGRVITGNGPDAAEEFGRAIVAVLK